MAIPYQQISENVGTIFDNPSTKWLGPVEFDSDITVIPSLTTHMIKIFEPLGPKSDITTYKAYTHVPINTTLFPFTVTPVNSSSYNFECTMDYIYDAGPDVGVSTILKQSHRAIVSNTGVITYSLAWWQAYNGAPGACVSTLATTNGNIGFGFITSIGDSATVTWKVEVFRISL